MPSALLAPRAERHWTDAAGPPAPAATLLDEVERFVRDAVAQLPPDPGEQARAGPGRPRILPALALWAGLLGGVLRGFGSRQALWRLLSVSGLWGHRRFPA